MPALHGDSGRNRSFRWWGETSCSPGMWKTEAIPDPSSVSREAVTSNHMAPLSARGIQLWRKGVRSLLTCSLFFLRAALWAQAPEQLSLEDQVKAAFLLNYTKFTEWPASAFSSAAAPISICTIADDRFDLALRQIVAGETVGGRGVSMQRIKQAPPPKSCQVLFISSSERENSKLLASVGPGVLTVGEGEIFLRAARHDGFRPRKSPCTVRHQPDRGGKCRESSSAPGS